MEGRYVNVVIPGRASYLTLCEVEVYDADNLAFNGTVTQSSSFLNRGAELAVDGTRYSSNPKPQCSTTSFESSPWWRLDLVNNYDISTVIITARSDGYVDQTNGAEIRIGNSLANNGNNNPIYSCQGMDGRYVNVVMTGRTSYLTLCEVEVYGKRHRKQNLLRLKFSSSGVVAAESYKILQQSVLAVNISDFNLSWTQLPEQEEEQEEEQKEDEQKEDGGREQTGFSAGYNKALFKTKRNKHHISHKNRGSRWDSRPKNSTRRMEREGEGTLVGRGKKGIKKHKSTGPGANRDKAEVLVILIHPEKVNNITIRENK
ncbi:Fucolectin-5 Precursor [Triplophysa tibetana]|uniref:Fucolectin-5 n=1 Tax=Triplophysa tibetana TaxID=1572043 RepID=A0A5A9PH87_9TELE|nr:Fucolectin-5 Precursor [Triplophysa tibetana]